MRSFKACVDLLVYGLLAAPLGHAGTVTGQITSSLVLTNSCQVNGSTASSGLNFGTANFGAVGSLFTTANAQVLGGGGGAIAILCSADTSPVLKIRVGSHDGQSPGGTRALADGAGHFVPYDFYADAGHTNVLPIDATITLPTSTGAAQTVNVYAKAVGKVGLLAGTYTDTVTVELAF